jgi:UDP-N-acetylmuramoyl-tripeptide--D-alanyl-D-alanine ligase
VLSRGPRSIIRGVSANRVLLRVREQFLHALYVVGAQALYWAAVLWRRMLRRTTFIAVTGTHGKTTTKEILATVLGLQQPTFRTTGNQNTGLPLTLNILRVRPSHRYAVIEVGVGAPGEMRRLARLVHPDVALMLPVLKTHMKTFADQDAHAREKAVLLDSLSRNGVAILDADDPRVAGMAPLVKGRIVRSGTSPAFDVWADAITSRWPERLEFDIHTSDGESHHVRTRLVGAHWCPSVTAALAAARSLGVPLEKAAAAVELAAPFPARMQPVVLPSGAVMLRDDYDGSFDAFRGAVRVLADARAARRIAVIADASDFGSTARRKRVARLGREIAPVAEVAIFVGVAAIHGKRGALAAGLAPENAHAFRELREAADFLRASLGEGDLVLLRGRVTDHLGRLFFAQLGEVGCWKAHCSKVISCDDCPELGAAPEDRRRARIAPVTWAKPGLKRL